jgi:dynactin complex subunit
MEEKIAKANQEIKKLKQTNANLKSSNENHIFINEKLNKALKKSEQKIE